MIIKPLLLHGRLQLCVLLEERPERRLWWCGWARHNTDTLPVITGPAAAEHDPSSSSSWTWSSGSRRSSSSCSDRMWTTMKIELQLSILVVAVWTQNTNGKYYCPEGKSSKISSPIYQSFSAPKLTLVSSMFNVMSV